MRLAAAPPDNANDGAVLTLPPELLQLDARLEPLFAPFRECVVVHEALTRDRGTSGPTRLLMAELRGDRYDEICALVQRACPMSGFVETLTDNDDVAAGKEWRERGVGAFSVFVYRLFGGSTAIHSA